MTRNRKVDMPQGEPTAAGRPCPICGKPAVAAFRPFCSDRCAKADLGHWLRGAYVLPGETPADLETMPDSDDPESR
ncbi:MAG: DNA gyrase inhibitor YacG [Rhodothalassiaceae bacterium]